MAEKKEGKIVLNTAEVQDKILEGAQAAYDAAAMSYGPKGRNVILEKSFGRPMYTRDGITILRDTFFSDRGKQLGAAMVRDASEASNLVAGDGSTQAGLLTYLLYENGRKAIASGKHPMDVADTLVQDSYLLLEKLKDYVTPVKEDEQLRSVAIVSAGDPLIGELIADAVLYVGQDGGILTEKAPINEVEREYVDGYYLQSGFTALQAGSKEIVDPYVVVSSKRLTSRADATDLLNGVARIMGGVPGQPLQQIPRILFVGNFEDAAYFTIVDAINKGLIDAVIIKTPPMYGELGKQLLEDIALYAGCEPITDSTNLKNFVTIRDKMPYTTFIGIVDKVMANKSESTIFADNSTEAIRDRVVEIKDQIDAEVAPSVLEKLRDRVAKLEGKIAIFKIGGATDTERERLEFQIEDAINSTRNAYAEGIVPGGGVTLLQLSKLDISEMYRDALQSMFKQLLVNANLPSEVKLKEALEAKQGFGYNLRKGDDLVDVIADGVIDPYVVVREVIFHATSMASETLKLGLGIVFEDND